MTLGVETVAIPVWLASTVVGLLLVWAVSFGAWIVAKHSKLAELTTKLSENVKEVSDRQDRHDDRIFRVEDHLLEGLPPAAVGGPAWPGRGSE
ncbi:MAG: hypothetical protein GY795_24685 [Desulfobacterales bacterium]|nr:hypothetical protein [Desulfobacterales bacterium]